MTAGLDQVEGLLQAIAALEGQRQALGEVVVESSIAALRKQLAEIGAPSKLPQQQRKLATLLYVDVVGSTNLSKHLEPDEVLDMMDAALQKMAEPVKTHGGHIARFQGDGFKAVFGLPLSREDDPEHAVRAGLEILEIAKSIAGEWEERHGLPGFQVRVGINTGLVAAGGETEAEDTIMGMAVNLAARLERAAPPGSLLISHHTYRHVRGVFTVEPGEPIQVKGFEEPVPVYLVKRAKPRAFRLHTRGVEGVETRMVGRESELKTLKDALLTAIEEGEGGVVTVTGEAGVGKSRLLYEFQNWLDLLSQAIRLFLGQARQETQHQPYALLRDLFAHRFQIQENDSPEVMRGKFAGGILKAFPHPPSEQVIASAHISGQLLGYDFSHIPNLHGYLQDPQALRNRGLRSLENYFTALCSRGLVAILLEDVHWADDSSLDAIRQLGKQTSRMPLLIVCLARQRLFDRRPYWGEGEDYHRKLGLEPLTKRENRQLVTEILKYVDHVPQSLRELVVQGADGNPFYTEELVKMLIEQGVIVTGELDEQGNERWQVASERLVQLELPSTLAGVLQARLDSLPMEERLILQQASVVGRSFWDRLIDHLTKNRNGEKNGKKLDEILGALRAKEMLFRREESTISGAHEFTFKHDLLRDVAYQTVLVRDRQHYHGLVADWLVENSGERAGEYLGLIGEHLERAGRMEQAMQTFLQAGDHSLIGYANREAESHYRRALALGAKSGLKAQVLSGLGRALGRQGRYDEAIKYWKEAIEIYRGSGDQESLLQLYALAIRRSFPYHKEEGEHLCQEGLAMVAGMSDSPAMANFYAQLGRVYILKQADEQARQYTKKALQLAERFGDVEVQADALATHGVLKGLSLDEGVQALQKSIELAEKHNMLNILNRALNNLVATYEALSFEQYNFREFKQFHYKSLEVARLRADREDELFALIKVAEAELHTGELRSARDILSQIEDVLESLPWMENQRNWLEKGKSWLMRLEGDWLKSRKTLRRALENARDLLTEYDGYSDEIIDLFPLLREIDRFIETPDWFEVEEAFNAALHHIREGFSVFPNRNNSIVYGLMSILFSRQRNLEQAENWLITGRESAGEPPTFEERWVLSLAEVELAVARKEWDQALKIYASIVDLMEASGRGWHVARTYLDWADACLARGEPGDRDQAEKHYSRSLSLFSKMGAAGYVEIVQGRLEAIAP
jgi:class 3 adenylate cyclase/tetratricopeptide (TPR) repeat protein